MKIISITRSSWVSQSHAYTFQSFLNAADRLVARPPQLSHISTCLIEVKHWLMITSRIEDLCGIQTWPCPQTSLYLYVQTSLQHPSALLIVLSLVFGLL